MGKFIGNVLAAQDVVAHKRVLLCAGVGAGKNNFFERRFTDYRVLIVTSRKAKVDQANLYLERQNITNVHYQTYTAFSLAWKNFCTTKKPFVHITTNGTTYSIFETDYDIIVFDEAHALIVDATFADDRDICFDFLQYEEGIENVTHPTVVLCTATPQPLLSYCKENNFHEINLLSTCRNLVPNRIVVCSQSEFLTLVGDQPFSYFPNFKKTLASVLSHHYKLHGRKKADIFYAGKKCDEKDLPDTVFSTSVLREGVNIMNAEPSIVAVETHDPLEIYQIAGRFRGGVKTLYVIWDCHQNKNELSLGRENFYREIAAAKIGQWGVSAEELKQSTNGWLRKSCFSCEVSFNELKFSALKRHIKVRSEFDRDARAALVEYFGNEVDIEVREKLGRVNTALAPIENYDDFRDWLVNRFNHISESARVRKVIGNVARRRGEYYIDAGFRDSLLDKAQEYGIVTPNGTYYSTPNNLLKRFGFRVERLNNSSVSKKYNYFRVINTSLLD